MVENSQRQILIADDERDWRERIALSLKDEGYNIHFAVNDKEAIEILQKENIDLAFMNVLLRGGLKEGWKFDWTNLLEVAKQREIAVIVITALNKVISLDEINEITTYYGVKEVFFKDKISKEKLIKRVKQIL